MAAMSLILLPAILNTVKLSTLSALGNISRNSEKLAISVAPVSAIREYLVVIYQASSYTTSFQQTYLTLGRMPLKRP